jgi:hypothetical protein
MQKLKNLTKKQRDELATQVAQQISNLSVRDLKRLKGVLYKEGHTHVGGLINAYFKKRRDAEQGVK